jgi:hypothetical protein
MFRGILRGRQFGGLPGGSPGPGKRRRPNQTPVVLPLADRRLVATLMVTNVASSGAGSLSQAIAL